MPKATVFKLFGLTIVFILVVPSLVQHGMFMDGVQYAIVSKNLALNNATFWMPYLSSSWTKMYSNSFLEHPPLVYYLQSKFFLLFGYGIFTEKIYCFCSVVICAFLIYRIWDLIFKQSPSLLPYWWLAVLLWFITPSVFWSFRNNMIENTVSVMVLAASYFSLKAIYATRWNIAWIFMSGFFIFLATLSKGLPGFFPITIIFCYSFFIRNISLKKTLLYSLVLVLVPLTIYYLLFNFNPEAKISLTFYIKNRLLNRLNEGHTVDNRFTILFWLFTDLLVNLIVCALLFLIFKTKTFLKVLTKEDHKVILFFLLFGLCGVLPLSFTHVQRAVYFVPALPFFGIAFAVFLAKGLDNLILKINPKTFKYFSVFTFSLLLSTIVLSITLIGKTGRDEQLLIDASKINLAIGENKLIGTPDEIYQKWDFQFYLLRYYNITLDPFPEKNQPYKLFDKQNIKDTGNYEKVNVDLEKYILFKKRN